MLRSVKRQTRKRQAGQLLFVLVLVCVSQLVAGERFRVKAKLWTGAPPSVDYRHSDVITRGTYMAVLEKEEDIYDVELQRRRQVAALPATVPSSGCSCFRKVFRSVTRDGAVTRDARSLLVAPVRLEEIHLAAYCSGQVAMSGRVKHVASTAVTPGSAMPERTDGCHITIKIRGFGSTGTAFSATEPDGPVLFECSQTCWVSKQDDRVVSLISPVETYLSRQQYTELTHLQVEVETRRNR